MKLIQSKFLLAIALFCMVLSSACSTVPVQTASEESTEQTEEPEKNGKSTAGIVIGTLALAAAIAALASGGGGGEDESNCYVSVVGGKSQTICD